MPQPSTPKKTLVLCDGDLPGMVALSLTQDALGSAGSCGVLAAPVAADHAEGVSARIRSLAESQAAECVDFPAVAPAALTAGARRTRYLTEAVHHGMANGYGVLVCPWQAGAFDAEKPLGVDEVPTVDRLARELDRALLISRLVTLDASEHGVGVFEVQTPLMDLSDAQVAELALDLDVPIWRAWWWEVAAGKRAKDPAVADRANALRDRWCGALESLGWSIDAELAASR
ncbi:MAG: hypothetical protein RIE77_13565 [Phycisphaerales bacterium]|jgi:hypothetical protein